MQPNGGLALVLRAGNQGSVLSEGILHLHLTAIRPSTVWFCVQGAIYRTKAKGMKPKGGVALVLGAGNQGSVVAQETSGICKVEYFRFAL